MTERTNNGFQFFHSKALLSSKLIRKKCFYDELRQATISIYLLATRSVCFIFRFSLKQSCNTFCGSGIAPVDSCASLAVDSAMLFKNRGFVLRLTDPQVKILSGLLIYS